MIEFFIIFGIGLCAFILFIYFTGPDRTRSSANPESAKYAEAKASLAFETNDAIRAKEYEHQFSGTRTGMIHSRSGY